MSKTYIKSGYTNKSNHEFIKPQSKRTHIFEHEESSKLRRKVLLYLGLVILIYLIYFLFYSEHFKIDNLILNGNSEISNQELQEIIYNSIDKNSWLIFPQNNYFLLNKSRLLKDFQEKYTLDDLLIIKYQPDTLYIEISERRGSFFWKSNERYFLFNAAEEIFKEIDIQDIVNSSLPLIQDESNTEIQLGQKVLNEDMIDLIIELFYNFESYQVPIIEIESFKIAGPKTNYLKIVTKQGFEIYLNSILSLNKQLYKLKRSLEERKIDVDKLNLIEYINLRIENQVIYK